MTAPSCEKCLRRAWLTARLSGHIDIARKHLVEIMELSDTELIAAIGGRATERVEAEYRQWGADAAEQYRRSASAAAIELICSCDERYPTSLRDLAAAAPRVLHVSGGMDRFLRLCEAPCLAIVGARRCTAYGRTTARELAADVASGGVTVVSGMAAGIDSAAHDGALSSSGNTIAVMPCAANLSYPSSAGNLHRRVITAGVAVSELPPGTRARAWTFRARNRIVVGLAAAVVVVQALPDSGTLLTAGLARKLQRRLGAVPGHVDARASDGPHQLIRAGHAELITRAEDLFDLLHLPPIGVGGPEARRAGASSLSETQQLILSALESGKDSAESLISTGVEPAELLKALAQLELMGRVRTENGGRLRLAR